MKTTFHLDMTSQTTSPAADAPPIKVPTASAGHVNASCNASITVSCILELYNAVGYNASASSGSEIGVTGYLDRYANRADLQAFYAEQRPDALGSSFKLVSVNGEHERRVIKNMLASDMYPQAG